LNEEKTESVVVAEYHTPGLEPLLGKVIPLDGDPMTRYLVQTRAPAVADLARNDPRPAVSKEGTQDYEPVSQLVVPLVLGGQVAGTLEIDAGDPRTFGEKEIGLVQRVADQISSALARARLEETQRRLSVAVEQAAEAVIITDTAGTILYANPAFEQITGYRRDAILGGTPGQFEGISLDDKVYRRIWETITAGQNWQGQIGNRRLDGSNYVVDLNISPVRNRAGDVVNYVGTMRDVTREVQLEEQVQQAQKMEALGRLAGGIAHDFNNLLTVIHLSTRLLERQLRPEDPLWEHVQHIRQTGERAANLTKQLLSFSRREVIEPQVLNLNRVVGEMGRMLQRIIGEDIELETCLANDLWMVEADPARLEQVIMNLVINARDAMEDGGTLTIETANITLDQAHVALHMDARPGDHVILTITDTGEGMDDEVKAHLFEPFFTTKERGQGTGLGLSTVFGIVKHSEGHINVESQVGQGTTFRIYLPRCRKAEDRGGERTHQAQDAALAPEHKTILIVEDDSGVRDLAVRVLESYGYKVFSAKDGSQAEKVSQDYAGAIHLLITDVVMPQMNGRELASRLRRQRPGMAVIYMSGYADTKVFKGTMPADAGFLSKPFTVEDLGRKVRAALEKADQRDGA
jgi:PAS domain S-box-containing protein